MSKYIRIIQAHFLTKIMSGKYQYWEVTAMLDVINSLLLAVEEGGFDDYEAGKGALEMMEVEKGEWCKHLL